ncbi:MAG: DUF1629 domain-containing protein [Hyphomicrobium sp.]
MTTSPGRSPRKPRPPKLSDDDYVYVVRSSVTGGGVYKEYRPDDRKCDLVVTRLQRGETLTPEEMADFPRELIFDPKSRGAPEIMSWSTGPHIVCPQFRDWLEELEPGRHVFHPIHVQSTRPIKGVSDHGTYYLIVRPPVIDAIIPEGTVFRRGRTGPGAIGPDGRFHISASEDTACYIRREPVEGHHFWYLKGGAEFMFSPELLRRYRAHKFRGLDVIKKCILK